MFVTRPDCRLPDDAVAASGPAHATADHSPQVSRRRPFPAIGPFASVSSAVMTHLPPSSNKSRKEQATGMEFPDEYCVLTQKNCPVLMGFG